MQRVPETEELSHKNNLSQEKQNPEAETGTPLPLINF